MPHQTKEDKWGNEMIRLRYGTLEKRKELRLKDALREYERGLTGVPDTRKKEHAEEALLEKVCQIIGESE